MIEEGNKSEAKYVWIKTKWGACGIFLACVFFHSIAVLWMGMYGWNLLFPYCFFAGLLIPLACCYYGDRVVGCVEINQCVGCTDNSSQSHFSAMTWPRWLRRAVRNQVFVPTRS